MLPASAAPPTAPSPSRGLAIASLILGAVSVVLSFLLIGGAVALAGVVLASIHLWRARQSRNIAVGGFVLSVFGLAASIGFGVLYYTIINDVARSVAQGGQALEWIGVQSPDFSVTTVDGRPIKLSDFRGKRVVVDYWATWCGPCRMEVPHFNQLQDEVSEDELFIIGITNENERVLKAFLEKNEIRYPVASVKSLPAPYSSVVAIPTTFFIDRNGTIQSVLVGYKDFEVLKQHSTADDYQNAPEMAP